MEVVSILLDRGASLEAKDNVSNRILIIWQSSLVSATRKIWLWLDLTRLDLCWLELTWLYFTLLDLTLFYLTWLDLTWLDLTWLDLTWLDLTWLWLYLTWLELSWLDLITIVAIIIIASTTFIYITLQEHIFWYSDYHILIFVILSDHFIRLFYLISPTLTLLCSYLMYLGVSLRIAFCYSERSF